MKFNRDRKIKLIAISKRYKQNGRYFVLNCIEDPDNGGIPVTGLELLPKELVNSLDEDIKVKAKEDIVIRDGQSLDLQKDYDLLVYTRCLIHSTIANHTETVNSQHIFRIHDEEYIADKESKETDALYEALEYLGKQNENAMRDIAIFLGIEITNKKYTVIKNDVRKKAISNPDMVIKYRDIPNRENYLFVKKLVAYKIISNRSDGYFYKERYIANTVDGMSVELYKSENKALLSTLSHHLAAILDPSVKGAQDFFSEADDSKSKKLLQEKEEQMRYKDLLFQYYKLAGKDYDGPENIKDLEFAIECEGLVSDFVKKANDMELDGLKKSIGMREGSNKEVYSKFTTKEEFIDYGKKLIIDKANKA
jgi:hypothetical protein